MNQIIKQTSCYFWRHKKTQSSLQHAFCNTTRHNMGWLRSVESIKLLVSFAEYCLFYKALLQKRPINLSILLTEATPYAFCNTKRHKALCNIKRHDAFYNTKTHNAICDIKRHKALCNTERHMGGLRLVVSIKL